MKYKAIFVLFAAVLASANLGASGLTTVESSLAGAALSRSTGIENDVLNNPSMMSFGRGKFGAGLSYTMWMPTLGSDQRFAGAAAGRFGRFSAGLNASYTSGTAYEIVSTGGTVTGDFTPSDMNLTIGGAFGIGTDFSVGLNIKYLSSKLSDKVSTSAFGAGIFAAYSGSSFAASLGVQDLGAAVKGSSGTSYSLPGSVLASATYCPVKATDCRLDIDASGLYYFNGGISVAAGTEFSFRDMLFARAGYRFASDKAPLAGFAACGLGVKFFGVSLDFSYLFASTTLSGTMLAGLRYSF